MSKLRIVSVGEVKTATDGRKFYSVGLRAGFGQRVVYRNFWEQFRRDKQGNRILDQKFWERGTPEEAIELLKNGELIEGEKVTCRVEAYEIPGTTGKVDKYTTVVFPDEDVEAVFDGQNHPIIDETTGEVKSVRRSRAAEAERVKAILAGNPGEEGEQNPGSDEEERAHAADLLNKN